MSTARLRSRGIPGSGPRRPRTRGPLASLLVCVVAVSTGVACGGSAPEPAGDAGPTASVVVSVPPLAWFVEELGGDAVAVTVMIPPGASPAMYDPTIAKVRAVSAARLYVAVGHPRFPFEQAWLDELVAGHEGLRLLRSGAGCVVRPEDPHLWLSPACARIIADSVAGALSTVLPEASDAIAARLVEVRRRIDEMDRELGRTLGPYAGRSFLVFHPSLGYLARTYGLEQVPIQRGASEPSAAEVASVVDRAREEGIRHVFVQPQFSAEAARMVARQLPGGRVVTVDPLAPDWPGMMRGIGASLARSFEAGAGDEAPTGGSP